MATAQHRHDGSGATHGRRQPACYGGGVAPRTVLIAPPGVLPRLRALFGSAARLDEYSDGEARAALEHTLATRPQVVALERGFAGTARGRALIERLVGDPALAGCHVRIVSETGEAADPLVHAAEAAEAAGPRGLDPVGTRRAPRVPLPQAEALLDGTPVQLVDISASGSQVISPTMVRPNQRVRVAVAERAGVPVRCRGTVVWSRLELPPGAPPHYRAGIEFPAHCFEAITAQALGR
jgi:hypothetical protein